jgi:anaerobic magnesium-protoporphyrin IX monomethyl ester cyclase
MLMDWCAKLAGHLRRRSDIVWLDLGDLGDLVRDSGPLEQWQDHGLGLLRTILHDHDIHTDLFSTRAVTDWPQLRRQLSGYRMLLMNVRSYNFPIAREAARLFKRINPEGLVVVGGIHATVAPTEMDAVAEFDRICIGPGEGLIVDLVRDPAAFPRLIQGKGARSMADWPMIDRRLWPKPASRQYRKQYPWPLEPACGWGPPPVATVLTSRVCPWQCAFCNESAYIAHMGRKPVDQVIEELNELDQRHGPIGSVVIHDSMFFQNPAWLEEWLQKYPTRTRQPWPYWAAARSDTVRRWPELFERLVRDTNWNTVSIGFESGSDRVLKILNKECTEADNAFAIALLDRIGDQLEAEGREPPKFWANIMLGVPGETREDAFKTLRMLRSMKRAIPSIAFYAPYPGSALGHQIIAEGKSLMNSDNYHRYPHDEKMQGVDYGFYRDLIEGRYEQEIEDCADAASSDLTASSGQPHRIYLFARTDGGKTLSWGRNPADALEILAQRLSSEELASVIPERYIRIRQRELGQHVDTLGQNNGNGIH